MGNASDETAEKILISYVVAIVGRCLTLTFGVAPGKKFTTIAVVWELGTGAEHPHTSLPAMCMEVLRSTDAPIVRWVTRLYGL
jgi:hypothetical protein